MEKKITDLGVRMTWAIYGKVLSVNGIVGNFKGHQRRFVSVANRQYQLMISYPITSDLIAAVLTGPVKTKATRLSVKMEPW